MCFLDENESDLDFCYETLAFSNLLKLSLNLFDSNLLSLVGIMRCTAPCKVVHGALCMVHETFVQYQGNPMNPSAISKSFLNQLKPGSFPQ